VGLFELLLLFGNSLIRYKDGASHNHFGRVIVVCSDITSGFTNSRQYLVANPVLELLCLREFRTHDKAIYVGFWDILHLLNTAIRRGGQNVHPFTMILNCIFGIRVTKSLSHIICKKHRLIVDHDYPHTAEFFITEYLRSIHGLCN